MNAQEVQKKGIEYCKTQSDCKTCHLLNYGLCINDGGDFVIREQGAKRAMFENFIEFTKGFNFMLKEIYKDDTQTTDE